MLKLLLAAILLIGIAFAGIAVKMFFSKDGQFKKSCSSIDPNTGKAMDCSCGSSAESSCNNG
ncbi:MAG TPA: hypothetical protein PK796_08260 [Bacteroidales bacterium]|jgi:hypothetical protein|nr:hypothetical protein [Bacteroidales bacterium]